MKFIDKRSPNRLKATRIAIYKFLLLNVLFFGDVLKFVCRFFSSLNANLSIFNGIENLFYTSQVTLIFQFFSEHAKRLVWQVHLIAAGLQSFITFILFGTLIKEVYASPTIKIEFRFLGRTCLTKFDRLDHTSLWSPKLGLKKLKLRFEIYFS